MEKKHEEMAYQLTQEAVRELIKRGDKVQGHASLICVNVTGEDLPEEGGKIGEISAEMYSTRVAITIWYKPTTEELAAIETRAELVKHGTPEQRAARRAELLAELAKLDDEEGEE